nr:response regulator transcription factor [Bacteroidota bacterium]
MNTLKAVIVDDESDAVNFIKSIIDDHISELKIVGTANSAKDGVKVIRQTNPDIVFLDVEMPHGNGFTVLEHFPEKTFDVVFVTAFNHYAIQAIKLSAVDYILKPINIKEFIAAAGKIIQKHFDESFQNQNYSNLFQNLRSTMPSRLAIPTSEGMEYLNTKDILRVEADRSYSWFYLVDGRKILVSRNLKEYHELLADKNFFRPHNSHLINLEYVKKYIRHEGGYIELTDGTEVPVARGKKDLFLAQMQRLAR